MWAQTQRLILLIHFLIQSLIVFHTTACRAILEGTYLLCFPVSRQRRNFPHLCVIWNLVHSAESRSKNKKSLGVIKIGVTSPRYYLGIRSTCFRTRKHFCCLDQILKVLMNLFSNYPNCCINTHIIIVSLSQASFSSTRRKSLSRQ